MANHPCADVATPADAAAYGVVHFAAAAAAAGTVAVHVVFHIVGDLDTAVNSHWHSGAAGIAAEIRWGRDQLDRGEDWTVNGDQLGDCIQHRDGAVDMVLNTAAELSAPCLHDQRQSMFRGCPLCSLQKQHQLSWSSLAMRPPDDDLWG